MHRNQFTDLGLAYQNLQDAIKGLTMQEVILENSAQHEVHVEAINSVKDIASLTACIKNIKFYPNKNILRTLINTLTELQVNKQLYKRSKKIHSIKLQGIIFGLYRTACDNEVIKFTADDLYLHNLFLEYVGASNMEKHGNLAINMFLKMLKEKIWNTNTILIVLEIANFLNRFQIIKMIYDDVLPFIENSRHLVYESIIRSVKHNPKFVQEVYDTYRSTNLLNIHVRNAFMNHLLFQAKLDKDVKNMPQYQNKLLSVIENFEEAYKEKRNELKFDEYSISLLIKAVFRLFEIEEAKDLHDKYYSFAKYIYENFTTIIQHNLAMISLAARAGEIDYALNIYHHLPADISAEIKFSACSPLANYFFRNGYYKHVISLCEQLEMPKKNYYYWLNNTEVKVLGLDLHDCNLGTTFGFLWVFIEESMKNNIDKVRINFGKGGHSAYAYADGKHATKLAMEQALTLFRKEKPDYDFVLKTIKGIDDAGIVHLFINKIKPNLEINPWLRNKNEAANQLVSVNSSEFPELSIQPVKNMTSNTNKKNITWKKSPAKKRAQPPHFTNKNELTDNPVILEPNKSPALVVTDVVSKSSLNCNTREFKPSTGSQILFYAPPPMKKKDLDPNAKEFYPRYKN